MDMCSYNIHTLDALSLQNLIRKEANVKVSSNFCRGWIYKIDPVSKSLLLLMAENNRECGEVILIPGCNIKEIEVYERDCPENVWTAFDNVFKKEEVDISASELERRRGLLCLWLTHNRVPHSVTENLEIEVLQVATITAPYSTHTIRCNNEVVLDKVMKLVREAPGLEDNER